ncbi:MAG: transposase [Spirochaetaceae bacterium]|nr:transposase [Spirochaetaceae bacterium]
MDTLWEKIKDLLSEKAGQWGRMAHDNRRFINAVSWIIRTGAPDRDLPPEYGDWRNTHRRFSRWRDRDVWKTIADAVLGGIYTTWFMIEASYNKVHADGCGAVGGNQAMGVQKRAQYQSPSCYR